MSDNTPALITCAATSQPTIIWKYVTIQRTIRKTVNCYMKYNFGVKLKDVFVISFPCTSHQPVAFCLFHLFLLLPVKAFLFASIKGIIVAINVICQGVNVIWIFIWILVF